MSNEILCVIDMQIDFVCPDRNKRVVNEVIRLIHKARKNKKKILLVEYTGCSWTLSQITKAVRHYDNYSYVQKNLENGADYISATLQKSDFSDLTFHVCGVNWHQCVKSTADGLLRKGAKIIAYPNASNPEFRSGLINAPGNWNELKTQYKERLELVA